MTNERVRWTHRYYNCGAPMAWRFIMGGEPRGLPLLKAGGGVTLSGFFAQLGAPLRNVRWSWGSLRDDGVVFLRVWQDRSAVIGEASCIMILHTAKHASTNGLGYAERHRMVGLVRAGAPCYMVICHAKSSAGGRRSIAGFNTEHVFKGGRLLDGEDGNVYLENLGPVSVKDVLRTGT